ncbi:hypothetical protein ABZ027_42755, partial [Streptomyces sp. NPDC006332]
MGAGPGRSSEAARHNCAPCGPNGAARRATQRRPSHAGRAGRAPWYAAFRIVQEALTNVSKHAATETAHVRLAYADSR